MADGFLSSLLSRADDVREGAERYGRRASGNLRDAGDTLRDRGGDARGELSRLWGQLEDLVERRLSPAAHDAARYAGSYARDGRETALDVAQQLRDVTRSRPLLAIGIAVAATWAISSMLRSRR
ncbi:hypothetical protein [Belnapia rosea]|uniref:Membrane-anchored ribosome-binding protein, inhibits growth in stationary phase, ElaB/YqjD/DUF883 family n=1 Tax=Belnapia rosea TaxID=938405 RepID=A0A1G6VIE7_9PROT|nr:hypothetical protein [Belnapia rosea]SDB37778.1 hypothetical protein SAMN02927895_01416 [Belnapia rosea]SDD53339.1 hypothetical protein SAMN04487779_100959 [Belnapia rosea]